MRDEVGREPVGLTERGKWTILDILDPEVFVDPKALGDGI